MIASRRVYERCLGLGLGACVLASASIAQAEAEPIRVQYRADPSCPSADQFVDQVLGRTLNARLANANEPARTFEIVIEHGQLGFEGKLVIHETDGQTMARTVSDARCREVADVLALSMVLAIDPTAMNALEAGRRSEDDGQSSTARERRGPQASPEPKGPGSSAVGSANVSSKEFPSSSEHGADGASEGAVDYAVLLGPTLQSGVSPSLTLGGSIDLEVRPSRPVLFASAGVRLTALQSLPHSASGARASFEFLLARPTLCSAPLRPSASLAIGPCLGLDLGVVIGRGTELPSPRTEQRFWWTVEVPLRAELGLGKSWLLQLDAGLLVPLTRYHFVFSQPDTAIYDVPAFAFTSELKVGLQF
jgi:hypothetical protein